MKVTRRLEEVEARPRAVAVGTFDGVHRGHRAVIERLVETAVGETGLAPTVVTFDPHPREVLGYEVQLLASLQRRLELLEALGVSETLVVDFTPEVAALDAAVFARSYLQAIGVERVVAAEGFRFGSERRGDLALLQSLGLAVVTVDHVAGVSSSDIRKHVSAGEVREAAALLGRPVEVEGVVVGGDARGGTLGFPTANLRADRALLVPAFGIYAGAALGHRAATSIGINPHYGGAERRIEAFLLDFAGDLYGQRVIVELWERLRDEAVFESEAELVAQIERDVAATRAATRP